MTDVDHTQAVWSVLGQVTDPEIDESVTSLEFVTSVRIESAQQVHVEFRLPTYWCAPNFAFLMASDIRDAVAGLPWVKEVSVKLLDHFGADLINRSVALGQDFRQAFPGETDDDLSALRKKFLGKAFERRQELLMRHLLQNGHEPTWITQASLRDLIDLPLDEIGISLRNLYFITRRRLHPDHDEESLAFTSVDGAPLKTGEFHSYLRKVSGARRNAELNGIICRGLLAARKLKGAGGGSAVSADSAGSGVEAESGT
jgi:metal-sulfur cluster biosynthetic enzyme